MRNIFIWFLHCIHRPGDSNRLHIKHGRNASKSLTWYLADQCLCSNGVPTEIAATRAPRIRPWQHPAMDCPGVVSMTLLTKVL
jgi:hypothetical protein